MASMELVQDRLEVCVPEGGLVGHCPTYMGGGLANGSKPFVLGISPFLRYLRSTGDTDKWKGRILSFPILMPEVHGASAWALNGTILHYDLSRQGYSDGDGNLMTGDEAACLVTLCLRY